MIGKSLHTLGGFAFDHRWRIVSSWIVVLVLLGALAGIFMKPPTSAITIPGTEAQKALDRLDALFPSAGAGSARVVVEAPAGSTLSNYHDQIATLANALAKVKGVSGAVSPFANPQAISKDQTIAYIQVQLANAGGAVPLATLNDAATLVTAARTNNLTVEMGGDLINKVPGEILGVGEITGVVLALLVLLMTLGSLVSAGMPIATAVVAVGVSMAGLFSFGHLIEIGSTTPVLAVMLGLAVGIDYSLFIISKYRSYLLEGYKNRLAAAKSIGTAGNAVIFAAATVVIALSALTIVHIPFMTTMGLAAAATVAVAAMVAVTLIPALLSFAGNKIFIGKTRRAIASAQEKGPQSDYTVDHTIIWYRWGRLLTKYPIIVLAVALAVIVALALPARYLELGLPTDQYAAKGTTQRKAYDLLTKGFGAGFNGPLLVIVDGLPAVNDADRKAVRVPLMTQLNAQMATASASPSSMSPEQLLQEQQAALAKVDSLTTQYAKYVQLKKVADKIASVRDVKEATPALVSDTGTSGAIEVIPKSAPSDQATIDLIAYLRGHQRELSSAAYGVTGSTALQNDINSKLAAALPEYLAVVVGLSLILLIVAFRSILIPIKATLGFLLSVLAMFGVLVAAFQWGWLGVTNAPGPIVSFVPIIAIGVLFGLSMDYEFFIVSSMHEAYGRTKDAKRAVVDGFGLGSKVVTAAGIVMVSVFAGFITNHDITVQAIGFGLAFGVFIDAFVVRMTIVPAVMTLLGKTAWWLPKWLDKVVPNISIEGEEE